MSMRSLTDRAGTVWEVFEVFPGAGGRGLDHVPDQYRGGWLCFQSTSERRRLAPIPADWLEWDARAFEAALQGAEGFRRRTPHGSDTISREGRRSGEHGALY